MSRKGARSKGARSKKSKSSPVQRALSSADTLALDRLCGPVTPRDLFHKRYENPISERVQAVRSERKKSGNGTLNSAGIYQTCESQMWAALPFGGEASAEGAS